MPDEETQELMEEYDLDEDEAQEVLDVMNDLGVDEQDAMDLIDAGI